MVSYGQYIYHIPRSVALPLQISASVSNHLMELPDLTASVSYEVVESGTREALTAVWKAWVEEAGGWTQGMARGELL